MTIDEDFLRTPAGRLASLLNHIKDYAGRSTQNKTFKNREVLSTYLGFDAADSASYFAAIAEIMSMPVGIRRDVAALVNPIAPSEMLLQHMDRIEAALPQLGVPHGSAKQLWDQLGDEVIVGLQFTSRILLQGDALRAISRERLDEIRRLATDLIDEIAADSELSAQFREEVRRHAEGIIAAVNGYKIHGADGLLDEADALVGVFARSRESNSPRTTGALGRGFALANAIVFAAGVYVAPLEIAEASNAYSNVLELPASIEAPGEDVVDAEIVS